MAINFGNFFNSGSKKSKLGDFQDLEHVDGVSISTTSANLYNNERDDLVMFYFRKGAEHASVYTQSKIISENIKWNLNLKNKKINALLINTRNANGFTGKRGYQGLKDIAEDIKMDISTISRVTNGKYVQMPWGIKELKTFFSEGIKMKNGKVVSSYEVKKQITIILNSEDKKTPLNDDLLTRKINELGYLIARRTIAKYRESMNIPVARLRKK